MRLTAVVACLALLVASRGAQAQSYLKNRPGVFATVDAYGAPFVLPLENQTVGGSAGYRFGSGAEVALRVDVASETDLELFLYPRETFVGASAAYTFRSAASPLKVSATIGAAYESQSELVFSTPTRPAELRGDPRVSQLKATVAAIQHIRVRDGPVRLWFGAGPLAEVRRITGSNLVFQVGTPEETVNRGRTVTERLYGLALTAPVAVRVFGSSDLVVEPTVRAAGIPPLIVPAAQLTIRFDL